LLLYQQFLALKILVNFYYDRPVGIILTKLILFVNTFFIAIGIEFKSIK